MAKRNTNRRSAARAAIDLLLANGCGGLTLLFASRDASYTQALAARKSLESLIATRVRAYVEQTAGAIVGASNNAEGWTGDGDTRTAPRHPEELIADATARVVAALPRCASRSVHDWERWLDRQVADAVDDDPDNGPPSPTSPSATAQVSASWALHRLPIPRAQRGALVAAVLTELTPAERTILEAMQHPQSSWVDVAARLGLSMFDTKRLHRQADDRAHAIAVRLASRAAGVSAAPAHAAAA